MSPSRLDKAAAVIAVGIFGAIQKGWTLVTGLLVGVLRCRRLHSNRCQKCLCDKRHVIQVESMHFPAAITQRKEMGTNHRPKCTHDPLRYYRSSSSRIGDGEPRDDVCEIAPASFKS